MFIRIETTSGMPITRQIMDQIRALVASKSLEPGDRLLSVRALAHELAVNQNTVLRVYERLTAEGSPRRACSSDGAATGPSSPRVFPGGT